MVIIMIGIVIAWIIYAFVLPGNYSMDNIWEIFFEKIIFLFLNALILGYTVGCSGVGGGGVTGGMLYSYDIKYTIFNIGEWTNWAKCFLVFMILHVILIAIVEIYARKNVHCFIRDCLTLATIFIIGFAIARLFYSLATSGFLLSMLMVLVYLGVDIYFIVWLFGMLLWFVPTGNIAKMNQIREAKERSKRGYKKVNKIDDDSIHSVHSIPDVITGPYGHSYRRINVSSNSAEYISDHDSSVITIHDNDMTASETGANTEAGYFHW